MLRELKWFTSRTNTMIPSQRNNEKNLKSRAFPSALKACLWKNMSLRGLMKSGPVAAVTCPEDQINVSSSGCLGKEVSQKPSTLQYGEAWQRICGGEHELFWKPARDAIASSENPFLQLTIPVMEINRWLSPWNCGSALVVYVHYISCPLSRHEQQFIPFPSAVPCHVFESLCAASSTLF